MSGARGVIALALSLLGCGGPSTVEWHEESGYRWRTLAVPRRGSAGFTQLAASRTGLEFSNAVSEAQALNNRNLTIGSGVALGDVDGDGMVDVYLSRIDGSNALYRNLGDWQFENIAEQSGVAAPEQFSTGVVLADVDGDGDLDLLVTALGGPNTLFVNDGAGRFTEQTQAAGLQSTRGSTTATLADVDGDGDLDLYIANYKTATVRDLFPPLELGFDQVVQQVGDRYEIAPQFRDHYRVQIIHGATRGRADDLVLRLERAEPDWFYLNDGTGRFESVAFTSGRFLDEEGNALAEEPDYFGLVARFYDVDGDGDPDLYVCNDFEDPDHLWLNDGTGTFRAAPHLALRTTSNTTMAIDFADIDRDDDVDFFEVDMLSRNRKRRLMQRPAHRALPKAVGEIASRPQLQRNTLFVNRGDGTFAQVAEYAGVDASEWSWATLFLDVDLDGYEDILITTGHAWDIMDSDTHDRLRDRPIGADWRQQKLLFPKLLARNVAFRNRGDLTFEEVGAAWGFANQADISHGMAVGDMDGDGDLDVVINRLGSPVSVLRNNSSAPRVAVRLQGQAPNTQGVGAKIRVRGGPVPEQQTEVTLGGLYFSSSEPLYSFAAGAADTLTIVVDWRSGTRTVVHGARPNRLYEIHEPSADDAPTQESSAAAPAALATPPARPTTVFVDVSAELGHVHVDTPFDDYQRQPLLPNRLSQLGPGVTWYDVDRDGDEDLLLPAGRGGRLAYYRNDAGSLRRIALAMPRAPYDQSTVLAVPGGQNGTALLVGQSIYEARTPSEASVTPAVLKVLLPSGNTRASRMVPTVTGAVPGDMSSVGPLALADYDGDGDLDLFVGGRVIPAAYPIAASSRLFRNEGERFVGDETNQGTFASVGLVSAAVFTDTDGDGDPDLVLALEWGSLRLFINDAGRFTEQTEAWGLAPYLSRWNGLATGDFNADGRPDLVATSWGRNTRYRVDAEHPLLLYYADFDKSGSLDVIEAQYDDHRQGIVPLARFTRMRTAIPSTAARLRSFAAYADATVAELLGPGVSTAPRHEVTTLEHLVFVNRGGRFEPVPLPLEAQLAPAFYAGVADFDGDGHDDLFLSQNFFPTERETPRYDAGRGLWLKGDGTGGGGLRAVPGQVSGILVYGDQRGAALADYNGDGRVDLVVAQNGAQTKLYRNQGATPGLVVRLVGPPANPDAIGAQVRLVYADRHGPVREIQAGSGYWSHNGAVQVLGLQEQPTAVWVRWPGGTQTEVPLEPGMQDITIRMPQ